MAALTVIGGLIAIAAVGGLGFAVRPRPPAPPPGPARDSGEVDLPLRLPTPVARFYQALGVHAARTRRVDTFSLWGRARMNRDPLPRLPVTFYSEHRVGWSGRQLLAVTWYGLPVLRGVDTYVAGRGEMRIGRSRIAGPEIDQGENLFLWAELVLVPSVLATRPGVSWEAVSDRSARLRVPFGDGEDEMIFRFDPDTGLLVEGRAMRYQGVGTAKVGWRIGYERWTRFEDGLFPGRITVTWEDRGRPWFVLDIDGVAVNAPVSAQLTAGTPAGR